MDTGIIILAAGASRRFGKPKQLLPYGQTTLLSHTIQVAVSTGIRHIIVVSGAHAEIISPTILNEPVTIAFNNNWEKGMSTSVKAGIKALLHLSPQTDAIIIMLCDQPFINNRLLQLLISTKKNGFKNIVACSYSDTAGAPVLFSKKYFDDLLALQGDEGAKKILYQYPDDVAVIDFPQGAIDIDTPR